MKLIENIIEPKKIIVLWQAIDKSTNKAGGERYVVGEVLNDGAASKLKYYDNADTKKAVEKGFKGLTTYPFEPNKVYNGTVASVLSNRLPPNSRTDYADFLRAYRISPIAAEKVSALSLLASTTGNLTGDGFSFLPSFEELEPPYEFTFEIAGFRHNEGMSIKPISELQGAGVKFVEEPSNQHDADALAVYYNDKKLGFVTKGINSAIRKINSEHKITATIERINGTPERPNILVFVEVR